MEFTTLTPLWLILIALPVAWGAWRKSLVDRTPAMKWSAFGLRLLAVLLFLLALGRPYATTEREDMHLVHLIDISESVDPAAIATAADESETARRELRSTDRFSLLRFANGLARTDAPELREISERAAAGTADSAERGATRLATALLGSRLAFESGMSRRLVVFSDGVATDEGVADALTILEREGIDVRFRPMPSLQRPEAAMVAFEPLATVAYRGEIVRMRLRMRANQTMNARARVLHRGVAVAEAPVQLTANEEAVAMLDVEMTTPGESRWEAELIAEEDWFTENNQLSATITVKGEPRLLILHNDERRMRPLVRAMEQQGLILEVRGENGIPENLGEMLSFDALVIADVPAAAMSDRQMQMIRQYVSDFGGGVAMLGSENSFGLGGYYQTPVEEVLPLTSRYEQEKQKATIAIALVIDKSGSMGGQPIALARASARAVAEALGPQDQIAVIGFDTNAQVILPMTSAADRGAVFNAIDMLEAGGGTDAYPGMERGHQMLRESVAKVKHMIVLSDGMTPPRDYPGLVGTMRAEGITISTVALGAQAAIELMQQIARDGGGRYYETNDPATMPQIFTNETMQASRSAIKEDLYTSVVVGDHPVLAGYEDADLPFVLGYVMTRPKPTANILLVAESGDPLLAISRFGLGTGLAFTSDLTEKWGGDWLDWGRGPSFWAQVFRGIVRKDQSVGLTATAAVDDEAWYINIGRTDGAGRPIDQVNWNALATDERGEPLDIAIRQTGLGRYHATADLRGRDRATLNLRDLDHGLMRTLGWERGYPAEYRLDGVAHPAIAALPSYDPATPRTALTPARVSRDVSWWFVLASFTSLIGGLTLRRI